MDPTQSVQVETGALLGQVFVENVEYEYAPASTMEVVVIQRKLFEAITGPPRRPIDDPNISTETCGGRM